VELLCKIEEKIARSSISSGLRHLVNRRASQINRCAYCVKTHTDQAHSAGETGDRLDRLVVWTQVDDFTPAEKAALAWTEALTVLDRSIDLSALKAELGTHFNSEEVATPRSLVAMINLRIRLQIPSQS
jgi:AhpD family alkylhydroperoxidase